MSLYNGILTKPISIGEISQCLGHASGDLGTLCTSPEIKFWAKYKPVDRTEYEELTEEQRSAVGYGIAPTYPYIYTLANTDYARLFADAKAGNYSLVYKAPGSRFRILDFNGYNHNCTTPLLFDVLQEKGFGSVTCGETSGTLPENNLTINDIITLGALSSLGYGVVVKAPDGTYRIVGIDADDNLIYPPYISGIRQNYDVVISKNNAYGDVVTGTYECVMVLINKSRSEVYTLPMPPVTLNVTAAGYVTIFMYGTISKLNASGSKSVLSYTIEHHSVNGGTGTIPAGTIAVEVYDLQGNIISEAPTSLQYPVLNQGGYYTSSETIEYPFNQISGGIMRSGKYDVETQIEIDQDTPID